MSDRSKRLALAAGALLVVVIAAWTVVPAEERSVAARRDAPSLSPSPPLRDGGRFSPQRAPETRAYAIALSELQGLPSDAPRGLRLDIWVAWDPPITKRPRIERLLTGVELERIIPPVTADGPASAILRVNVSDIPNLLYADRYGAMSVTIRG